ncbi:MAG: hypothetical protein KIS67_08310 [Verrucomicrobiae bacterium]|nr:hypothetical protein [Verrucomicrobiae bacterium]
MPLMFEQQPRESNKAFAAFSLYLSLGPERSLATVAQKLNKSVTILGRWSSKFDWPARVAAHGAHLAVVEREAVEAVARSKAAEWESREQALRETEWQMHERAIAAAKRGLDAYMEREKVYANLADIARMLEIASKLGRLATGLGTDGERRKGDDLPTVRVEVTVALEKIYGEPLPGEVVDVEVVGGPSRTQNRVLASQTGSPGSQTGELPAQTGEIKP